MESVDKVLDHYDKHYFGDKWVECKLSYPKEAGNTSEVEGKKKTNTRSHKQDSSPFQSNEDPMQGNQEIDQYGMYPESNKSHSYKKPSLDYQHKRGGPGYPPGYYGPPHNPVHYYPPPYHYPYPSSSMMGYPPIPHGQNFQIGLIPSRQQPLNHLNKNEIYRNLNNEIAHQPMNPKMKTGSHAVGSSCHSDMHLVANSEDLMRRFPPSRGYSNYMTDFSQQKTQQTIVPPKRVLNRIGTCEFAYQKEDSPPTIIKEERPNYNQARYLFQNMKSSSLHPEDFQRLEYRAAHLSPSRIKISPNTDLTPINKFGMLSGAGPYDQPVRKPPMKVMKQETEAKDKKEPSED